MSYKCPLCGSPLSEQHYHRVIKSQEKERKALSGEMNRWKRKAADSDKRREAAEAKARKAKEEGVLTERKKYAGREKHRDEQIRRLKEANRMLRTHTSPQEMGLADEKVLAKRLHREFPEDRI